MALVFHVIAKGLAVGEVFGSFVFAVEAQQPHFRLLVKVQQQPLHILAVIGLGHEEPVLLFHVLEIAVHVVGKVVAEQAFSFALLSTIWCLSLGFHWLRHLTMLFGLHVLLIGLRRPKRLAKLSTRCTCTSCS